MDQNNNRMVAYRAKKEKKGRQVKRWNDEFKKIAGNEWTGKTEWKRLGEAYAQNASGTI